MGNICCDADERSKSSAFFPFKDRGSGVSGAKEDVKPFSSTNLRSSTESGGAQDPNINGETTSLNLQQAQAAAEAERKRREEQIRLDHIVSTTGRDMVTLYGREGGSGSTSFRTKSQGPMGTGNVAYYDPTYASAAARDMFRNDTLYRTLYSLFDESESGQHLDERRKKIMDILRGKSQPTLPTEEGVITEPSSKRIDWKELIIDLLPNNAACATSGMDSSLFLDENGIETEVLFQGLEPLIENLP